jgi:hypothetical protein
MQPPEVRKIKETDFPLEIPEDTNLAKTLR